MRNFSKSITVIFSFATNGCLINMYNVYGAIELNGILAKPSSHYISEVIVPLYDGNFWF